MLDDLRATVTLKPVRAAIVTCDCGEVFELPVFASGSSSRFCPCGTTTSIRDGCTPVVSRVTTAKDCTLSIVIQGAEA